MDSPARRRSVRDRAGRIFVPAVSLLLLLSACTIRTVYDPPPSAVSSPAPTSTAGCGLQQLPSSWQAALKPTTLMPATEIDLLAHDATTGRSLYLRRASTSSVFVLNLGGAQRTLFTLGEDEQPFGAAI